jgi:hypothetical protein
MTPWHRFFIFLITLPWDIITWLAILFMWACWGTNLCWEKEATQGSPVLTMDLKPNSWPARTWYTYKQGGKKIELSPKIQPPFGKYRTWGGTTLGPHAIFYGPGWRASSKGEWGPVQQHEHRHSEQGEAYMLGSFMFAVPVFVHSMLYDNNLWIMALVMWTCGYVSMLSNFIIAGLRGEKLYIGSHHEEAAYDDVSLYLKNH